MSTGSRRSTWYPAGRCLHLVDVENLAGAEHRNPGALREASELYRRSIAIGESDLTWVASNPANAYPVRRAWPEARLMVRHGKDGADLALLDAADPQDIANRFDRVVIASGDGTFATLALELRLLQLDVTVACRRNQLSERLRRAAGSVCILGQEQDVETTALAA